MAIEQFADAGSMLARVGDALGCAGAEGELSLGLLRRLSVTPDAWGSDVLLLAAFDGAGAPLAIATETGSFPLLVTGFVDPAQVDFAELVRAVLERRSDVAGVNGPERWSSRAADALASLTGSRTTAGLRTRAFELRTLRPPVRQAPGAMRPATDADRELVCRFVHGFAQDALTPDERAVDRDPLITRLIESADLVLWGLDGEPVSMAAVNRRTDRSSTVGLVYTPPPLRGHGYASAVVAALTQRELDAGAEWISLFTDVANPTSNHIYQELGYEERCDFVRFDLASSLV